MNRWLEILKSNNYDAAKKYIQEGTEVNEENESGESVLAYALRYRCSKDLLELLINNGADIFDFDNEGVSIFDMAVTYNNLWMAQYLVEKGVNVNETKRRSGFTPLMAASCYGRNDIVVFLLENAADINCVDLKGFSAIDFARKMNKKSVLKLLDYDEHTPKNSAHAR